MLTSDGWYMAKKHTDIGYNTFLGRPNSDRTQGSINFSWMQFDKLGFAEKKAVVYLAKTKGISLRDFLKKKS